MQPDYMFQYKSRVVSSSTQNNLGSLFDLSLIDNKLIQRDGYSYNLFKIYRLISSCIGDDMNNREFKYDRTLSLNLILKTSNNLRTTSYKK